MDRDNNLTWADAYLAAVVLVFAIWGIIDIFHKNTEFIADRFLIVFYSGTALALRKKLLVTMPVVLFGTVPVLLHSLNVYTYSFYGTDPGYLIHLAGGMAGALFLLRYFAGNLGRIAGLIVTILSVAGIGSVQEIIEYIGYALGGVGGGILFYGPGDLGEWRNAVIDMAMNTVGAVIGGMILAVRDRWRTPAKHLNKHIP